MDGFMVFFAIKITEQRISIKNKDAYYDDL
jgi:hypothetical protein